MDRILAIVNDDANRYRIIKNGVDKYGLYGDVESLINDSIQYKPDTSLENEDSWYHDAEFSTKDYCIDLIRNFNDFNGTVGFVDIEKNDIDKISCLIIFREINKTKKFIIFQKVTPKKILKNKTVLEFNFVVKAKFKLDDIEIREEKNQIVINDYPDAIYSVGEDKLYFKKLESIGSIFEGIVQLYREATEAEVENFLHSDFVNTSGDFFSEDVKVSNRKRIALVSDALNKLPKDKKKKIISYTRKYCPHLSYKRDKFEISSDKELKDLLYGIQEKYFTTEITKKKKCANSMFDIE